MAAPTPYALSSVSHDGIVEFFDQAYEMLSLQLSTRSRFENIDRQYQREVDATTEHQRAKAANRTYDPTRFQNIIVPVVMPQVESATSYLTGVFLTGFPIFGVVSSPAFINEALQLEAIVANQQIRGGWIREFIKFFRDGMKYNLQFMEVMWENETSAVLEPGIRTGSTQAKQSIWSGNVVRRLDPYNCFWDTRYQPADVHRRGDFNGYTDLMSRIELKNYIQSLSTSAKQLARLRPAFESSVENTYYIPSINLDTWSQEGERKKYGGMNWLAWAGLDRKEKGIDYKELYEVTRLNARIIPAEFNMNVPAAKQPQIWRFVIVNKKHVIYAERQTNAHGYLPMLIGQPLDDGLGYQTKALAENVESFQQLASALTNSNIASRRRAISDRVLYDPSRISPRDINSDNPAAKIPVRPQAYGKPLGEAVFPFPYREDQAAYNMQEVSMVSQFANQISGQNPVRQGQFVKGNKTKVEFQDVMGNATARDQMTAMVIEDQIMTPVKEMIKTNILQYQGAETLYNRNTKQQVNVDPIALRKAVMEFKMSDGLIPSDKLISGDEWIAALQFIGSTPEVKAGYNLAPAVSYLMKVRGADLREFEKSPEQMAYEQALGAWQQTTMEIAQMNMKASDPSQRQEFPPQPLPADYNYTPGGPSGSKNPDQV
jgi:hypothetical protein